MQAADRLVQFQRRSIVAAIQAKCTLRVDAVMSHELMQSSQQGGPEGELAQTSGPESVQ